MSTASRGCRLDSLHLAPRMHARMTVRCVAIWWHCVYACVCLRPYAVLVLFKPAMQCKVCVMAT